MIDKKDDQVFLRIDLNKTTTGSTAFFRLSKDMKDFLNLCRKKSGGECEAIVLTKEDDDESGDYHWNIGFVFPFKDGEKNDKK